MAKAIEAQDLSKNYTIREPVGRFGWLRPKRTVRALTGVSFAVEQGEAVSVIGPNGAGKTTLVKLLSGILVPSSGRLSCLGFSPSGDRMRYTQHIGVVMGQKSGLIFDLPVMQTFEFLGAVYGLSGQTLAAEVTHLAGILEVEDLLSVPVRKLSLGQRMRMELIAALLHRPALLFLDEPTIGLDLLITDRIHAMIRDLRERRQVTVILTTHNPRDIEAITNRAIILDQGRVRFDGGIDDLKDFGQLRTISFEVAGAGWKEELTSRFGSRLQWSVESRERAVGALAIGAAEVPEYMMALLESRPGLDRIAVEGPSLEEAIKDFFRNPDGAASGGEPHG